MHKVGLPSKGQPQRPARRMSIFTASQTLKAVQGWSKPGGLGWDRRDSRGLGPNRRDSVRTDGSSLQPSVKPSVKTENTYKTQPDETSAFKSWKLKETVDEILHDALHSKTYDPTECGRMTLQVASIIKTACKDMGWNRYKFVSHVVIGQNLNQCVEAASRGMWDNGLDGFVCSTYKNDHLFAVATLFAVYYE